MKVAVVCDSPLLKRCLEVFLKKHLSSYAACDFVISDKKIDSEKPIFIISDQKGSNLNKPFSKTRLLKALEEHYKKIRPPRNIITVASKSVENELETKIKQITENFVGELLSAIKEHGR
ncbi:MAG: hypothetical protein PHE67_04225 [Campylobacterales bacterium]|nr:hypothetical protein [Campylobacterales bacterium]